MRNWNTAQPLTSINRMLIDVNEPSLNGHTSITTIEALATDADIYAVAKLPFPLTTSETEKWRRPWGATFSRQVLALVITGALGTTFPVPISRYLFALIVVRFYVPLSKFGTFQHRIAVISYSTTPENWICAYYIVVIDSTHLCP